MKRTDVMKGLRDLVEQVPEDRRVVAEGYYNELTFMAQTLDKLKANVRKNGPVELFKNGAQEMWRESPALKGYNTTVQRYATVYKQLVALLPEDKKPEAGSALAAFIHEYKA